MLKCPPKRHIELRHPDPMAEIGKAGDPVAGIGHAAGYDGIEVTEVRLDVDRNAVE